MAAPAAMAAWPLQDTDSDGSEAAGAAPASSPAEGDAPAQGCSWRRRAVLVAALVGVVAVASRSCPQLARGEDSAVRRAEEAVALFADDRALAWIPDSSVNTPADSCANWNGNCHFNRCCLNSSLTCYEKDEEWAACIPGCTPGIHKDWDRPGKQTPWSCRVLATSPYPYEMQGDGASRARADAKKEPEMPAPEPVMEFPSDADGSACHDVPTEWADQLGNSCAAYRAHQLCTPAGQQGPGWRDVWGSMDDHMADGLSAAHACCACGGGSAQQSKDGKKKWHMLHKDWRCSAGPRVLFDSRQAEGRRLGIMDELAQQRDALNRSHQAEDRKLVRGAGTAIIEELAKQRETLQGQAAGDAQAPETLLLPECLDFCKDHPYAVFGMSQALGNCRCFSVCARGTHDNAPHDLVFMQAGGKSSEPDEAPDEFLARNAVQPPPDCALLRGGEQLAPLYQSCRANNGTGRLRAKRKDVSIKECMELARSECQASFGMEYPAGFSDGHAECVYGAGIADLGMVADVDCTAWMDDGKPLGGSWRVAVYSVVSEREAQNVPMPESSAIKSTTFFCFEVTVPSEANIVDQTRRDSNGIFACDDYMVIRGSTTGRGKGGGGDMTPSWTNVQPFLDAWAVVGEDGRYKEHTWVVKVDPDAVFVPQQLKKWLIGKEPDVQGSYVSTCGSCDSHNGFYGAMEVLSRVAAQRYVESIQRCKDQFGDAAVAGWGEDLFAQRCMNWAGVTCWDDSEHALVCDKLCGCWDGCAAGRAAYHPFKGGDEFSDCTNQAMSFDVDVSGIPL